jgi:hypothetical protein
MGLGTELIRVDSYIQVRIVYGNDKSEVSRTYAMEGNSPEWNEIINFAYESTNRRFSVEELVNNECMIYFSLFDEVKVKEYDDMTNAWTFSAEARFLGSFQIPLSTVL